MVEYWLTQLNNLAHSSSERLPDYQRINLFIEAANELDKVLRPRLKELNGV